MLRSLYQLAVLKMYKSMGRMQAVEPNEESRGSIGNPFQSIRGGILSYADAIGTIKGYIDYRENS